MKKKIVGDYSCSNYPKMIVKLFELIFGVITPLIRALMSGLVIIAVIKRYTHN